MENDKELMCFCQNIRYLRKKHNLTQKQMATLLGIGIQTLRMLEKNIVPPYLRCSVLYQIYLHFHQEVQSN